MEVNKQSKLLFHGVDFLNVNFKAIAPRNIESTIRIICTPKVFYPNTNRDQFNIVMDIELIEDNCFELRLSAVGSFELESELTEDLRKAFVNANASAIMFPYIRSFISTFTANLGNVTGTITIPTQFFRGDLEEIKEP